MADLPISIVLDCEIYHSIRPGMWAYITTYLICYQLRCVLTGDMHMQVISALLYNHDLQGPLGSSNEQYALEEIRKIHTLFSVFSNRVGSITELQAGLAAERDAQSVSGGDTAVLHTLMAALNGENAFLYPIDASILDALDMKVGAPLLHTEGINGLHAFIPSQLAAIMHTVDDVNKRCLRLSYLPVLPLPKIVDGAKLDAFVSHQSECLIQDVLSLDSLLGYSICRPMDRTTTCALLSNMLNSGLSYVLSHSSKLMGLFPCARAMRLLSPVIPSRDEILGSDSENCLLMPVVPRALLKRIKDMPRIFRNKVKEPLSLRLNTDISGAISKLRQHHGGDCWVNGDLEGAWRLMAATSPPMLMVFELWYGDSMIAADFAHPVCGGRSVYVATRFYDKSAKFKTLQPGFLLALLECAYLRSQGCLLWDLGGCNLCPLMRYKHELTGNPYSRPDALFIFNKVRIMPQPMAMNEILSCGPLVNNVTVDSLLI